MGSRRLGTVPQELLASLFVNIQSARLGTDCVPRLENESVEFIAEVDALLDRPTDLGRLVACHRVTELVRRGPVTQAGITAAAAAIEGDIALFEALLSGESVETAETLRETGGRAA